MLHISRAAGRQLQRVAKEHNTDKILFYVKGGGCNGFNYYFKSTSDDPKADRVRFEDIEVLVAPDSLLHLFGTAIDWKDDIMGQSFRFSNPNADSVCGCGTSFSV
jgi:iron-sulfur cluster assembly accessory protein